MNVQQLLLRDAMRMDVCEDARAHRQQLGHNPISQISAFVIRLLRGNGAPRA